jgi:NAD(P)-dependent dehydrogenase (short-subunit alcohol dehydrogenase family)
MDSSKRFSGKSVVVTGAANGMGKQITLDFLDEKATVIGVDVNSEALFELKKEVTDRFGAEYAARLITFEGDITKPETSTEMIAKAIEVTGEINILVNNAGVAGRSEPVTETKDEDWHRIIDVDLNGPMYSIREAVSRMLEQKNGGNIVTIASVAGLRSGRSSVAYTVAKHGLVGLCEHTAWAYMHKGIRCNMVCPGIIKTSMSSTFDTESEFGRERILAGLDPDQEFGEPRDISRTVLFLASDESKYINGASFVVDGGSNCS